MNRTTDLTLGLIQTREPVKTLVWNIHSGFVGLNRAKREISAGMESLVKVFEECRLPYTIDGRLPYIRQSNYANLEVRRKNGPKWHAPPGLPS